MAPSLKVDLDKLRALHSKGLTVTAIAEELGVTKGAVSKQLKKLNLAVIKSVALESAHKVVRRNLNAIDQLQKINQDANEILDLLMRWNRGDKVALHGTPLSLKCFHRSYLEAGSAMALSFPFV